MPPAIAGTDCTSYVQPRPNCGTFFKLRAKRIVTQGGPAILTAKAQLWVEYQENISFVSPIAHHNPSHRGPRWNRRKCDQMRTPPNLTLVTRGKGKLASKRKPVLVRSSNYLPSIFSLHAITSRFCCWDITYRMKFTGFIPSGHTWANFVVMGTLRGIQVTVQQPVAPHSRTLGMHGIIRGHKVVAQATHFHLFLPLFISEIQQQSYWGICLPYWQGAYCDSACPCHTFYH